jgi:hypothetical protein
VTSHLSLHIPAQPIFFLSASLSLSNNTRGGNSNEEKQKAIVKMDGKAFTTEWFVLDNREKCSRERDEEMKIIMPC